MFTVLQFPGSNDDRDMELALKGVLGVEARLVWHKERALPEGTQAVFLPGGFSYGDYLRCGAMARFSPIMDAVRRFADSGGIVLGTCNGFQVLCESGLLPGALLRNEGLHFVCEWAELRVERAAPPFTSRARVGDLLRIPIKHGDGRYFAPPDRLRRLEENGQIVLRYRRNPNGSVGDIAGIVNERGNVFGLMPHPEHAVDAALGGGDGLAILGSIVDAATGAGR